MKAFSFVHAADLHLDAPFRGIGGTEAGLARLLREATFTALDRLVDCCLASGADFLLLAGDVYNSAESSLRARLALRDALERLAQEGVGVFLAHGNHDPLNAEQGAVPWPENVTVFGKGVTSAPAWRRGESGAEGAFAAALVHGVSHASAREGQNLAATFKRRPATLMAPELFQIGLLHCALADWSGAHEAYAPCTFGDLAAAEMEYWALGHVHAPKLLDRRGRMLEGGGPHSGVLAAYAGSLQGLHVNESGPHGCLVGRVDANGRLTLEAVELAPVRWEQVRLEPGPDVTDVPSLELLALNSLEALAPARPEGASALCQPPEAVAVRLTLAGRSPLNHELREPGAADALREHLGQELAGTGVWLRDLIAATRPMLDVDAALLRPDLAGETLRTGLGLRDDPEALAEAGRRALEPLFKRPRVRRAVAEPSPDELAAMAEEAAFLCLDLLGAEQEAEDE